MCAFMGNCNDLLFVAHAVAKLLPPLSRNEEKLTLTCFSVMQHTFVTLMRCSGLGFPGFAKHRTIRVNPGAQLTSACDLTERHSHRSPPNHPRSAAGQAGLPRPADHLTVPPPSAAPHPASPCPHALTLHTAAYASQDHFGIDAWAGMDSCRVG